MSNPHAKINKYCTTCNNSLRIDNFYRSRDSVRHPDGYIDICKKCATISVDNWDPETFLWILRDCDVPYVPSKWNSLLREYGKDPSTMTGLSIIGRYLAIMQLSQFKKFHYEDTEFLQKLSDKEAEEALSRQGFSAAEIAEKIQATHELIPIAPEPEIDPEEEARLAAAAKEAQEAAMAVRNKAYIKEEKAKEEAEETETEEKSTEDYFKITPEELKMTEGLTDEDKSYLLIKWGKLYQPYEWVQLEQLYQEMMQSYDITQAGDINSLKLACKASLTANKLFDMGDLDGAQKASKVYDSLMKAGKWTAAQNKAQDSELVDSVGELVAICEADGFFPRYYHDKPNDKVDEVIIDNQKFLQDVVAEENGLGNMIELALKHIEDEKNSIQSAGDAAEEREKKEIDSLFDYDINVITTDEDMMEFNDFTEEQRAIDEYLQEGGQNDGIN